MSVIGLNTRPELPEKGIRLHENIDWDGLARGAQAS